MLCYFCHFCYLYCVQFVPSSIRCDSVKTVSLFFIITVQQSLIWRQHRQAVWVIQSLLVGFMVFAFIHLGKERDIVV